MKWRQFKDEVQRWSSVILLVAVIVLAFQLSSLSGSVETIKLSSSSTEKSATKLVQFVDEVKATQPCATPDPSTISTTTAPCRPSSQSQAVTMLITVLCASSDPVRIEACTRLTQTGGG